MIEQLQPSGGTEKVFRITALLNETNRCDAHRAARLLWHPRGAPFGLRDPDHLGVMHVPDRLPAHEPEQKTSAGPVATVIGHIDQRLVTS